MAEAVRPVPAAPREMRAFLVAQLQWERYRASRLALVHVLAVCAIAAWVPMPPRVQALVAGGCALCFLGAIFAGVMEWRWSRERNQRAGALGLRGTPCDEQDR